MVLDPMEKRRPEPRVRLDVLLVERGLVESREQAQRLILAGAVEVAGVSLPKAGMRVPQDTQLKLLSQEKYVSRGGLKLEGALEHFGVQAHGRVCADIGASTGGFTDCLLQHGAARVYAVDVGRSQLHTRLRSDARVEVIEQTNARELHPGSLPEVPQLMVVDVSFISLTKILGALASLGEGQSELVALIKPQFEATRQEVSRGRGVIKDAAVHRRVLEQVLEAAAQCGWKPVELMASPIAGATGNHEYLVHMRPSLPSAAQGPWEGINIDAVVAQACMLG